MDYTETDLVYGKAPGKESGNELLSVFYRPVIADKEPVPLVIDVHGGAWSSGHRKNGRHYGRRLAELGVAVLAIDFRHGPDFHHPSANQDIRAAVQFVRDGNLELQFINLGLIGSSSGGHLALLSGLKPNAGQHVGSTVRKAGKEENPGGEGRFEVSATGAEVDFVVALWPVSNPLARYQYVTARATEAPDSWVNFQPLRLAEGHIAYFENEQAMVDASIQRVLSESEHEALPRIFIVQPELDQNVPVFMTQTLHGALLTANADVRYEIYPGVEHGFAQAAGPQTEKCIADVREFITGVT